MGLSVKIQVVSASNVGGVYPFVVVCFDGDISNELYKTEAVQGGKQAVWNHDFVLDLTSNIKALLADGKPEPTYLTFFLFDTGTPGVPSLGSAGVLLDTVKDNGKAQGDFPVVNGNGTLRLVVETDKTGHGPANWSTKQKIAAGGGVAAVAAGITALAVNQHKKKKKKKVTATRGIDAEGESSGDDDDDPEGETPSRPWWKGNKSASSSSDDEPDAAHAGQAYPQAGTREVARDGGPADVYDDGDYGDGGAGVYPDEGDDADEGDE